MKTGESAGGRRGLGGILGYCNPKFHPDITIINIDSDLNYGIFEVNEFVMGVGYFSPSLPDANRKLAAFFRAVEGYAVAREKEILIFGDFNARTLLTGDSHHNTRGKFLESLLEEHALTIVCSSEGLFTSFVDNRDGVPRGGIPDVVITSAPDRVSTRVFETVSLGGSTHRPIIIDITDSEVPEREFTRWNIRKLKKTDIASAYVAELSPLANLIDYMRGENARFSISNLSEVNKSAIVKKCWSGIEDAINQAALNSLGFVKYRLRAGKHDEFWSQELQDAGDQLQSLQEQHHFTPSHVSGREVTEQGRIYRDMVRDRRKEMFRKRMDEMLVNRQTNQFQKLVNAMSKRQKRGKSGLQKSKVNEYIQHYASTFGADPTGMDTQVCQITLENTLRFSGIRQWDISSDSFGKFINKLPKNKACGGDGVFAELLIEGGPVLHEALRLAVIISMRLGITPTTWNLACIVPVYKKNDASLIANYRPIALTQTMRRLFERVLLSDLGPLHELLTPFQGGFRPNRSCIDQLYHLRKVMESTTNNAIHIMLDLKNAYDVVDRRILWTHLHYKYDVSFYHIVLLRQLFDNNETCLLLDGARSDTISNKRGLLQGSSLSPLLFNLFIDSLSCMLLNGGAFIEDGLIPSNHLMFADDTILHALGQVNAQKLIDICVEWARLMGMLWHPGKCTIVARKKVNLSMYDIPLSQVPSGEYLGLFIKYSGVDWNKSIENRVNKATNAIQYLGKLGMNAGGWSLPQSVLVYKTFIRPILEYGLQLGPVTGTVMKKLQCVQNAALRRMLSAGPNTSVEALHKVCRVMPLWCRSRMLEHKFHYKLQEGSETILTTLLYAEEGRDVIALPSIDEIRSLKHSMISGMAEDPMFGPSRVANAITLTLDDIPKYEPWFIPHDLLTLEQRNHLMRWRIGNVAIHQECKHCRSHGVRGVEASRQHAIVCSGVSAELSSLVDEGFADSNLNIIDYIMNMNRKSLPADVGLRLSNAIRRLRVVCFGFNDGEDTSSGVHGHVNWRVPGNTVVRSREVQSQGNSTLQRGRINRPVFVNGVRVRQALSQPAQMPSTGWSGSVLGDPPDDVRVD